MRLPDRWTTRAVWYIIIQVAERYGGCVMPEDKILIKFIARLPGNVRNHVKSIVLFGSRAKNRHTMSSDYDLLVVLDRKSSDVVNGIYDVVVDFLVEHGADISLKIYSEADYNKKVAMGVPFMREIMKHGEKLWTRK